MISIERRRLLQRIAAGSCLGAAGLLNPLRLASAAQAADDRILVVFELSGGNDGLNTVVPYTNDHYYKLRPTLGLKPARLLKLDDQWG